MSNSDRPEFRNNWERWDYDWLLWKEAVSMWLRRKRMDVKCFFLILKSKMRSWRR